GLLKSEATALFGQLSGMVEQIIFLPTVITTALTISLIPNISNKFAKNDLKNIRKNYEDILKIITYMGFPAALFFYIYGPEITKLIFSYPSAGEILSAMALSAPFLYYSQVSSAILNGLGKPLTAVKNMTLAAIIKIVLIYILVSSPIWQIKGVAIATILAFMLSSFLNYYSIKKKINFKLNFVSVILKPLISITIVYLLHPYLYSSIYYIPLIINPKLQIIYILFSSAFIYFTAMFLTGAITINEFKKFKF
ncbi:MAG: polysaccharide biosynthesis C-terminal domain-containing protein, partial [Bacillota bacterium]